MTEDGKMTKGEKSRTFLIETTVSLIVEAGYSEKVTIRDIAQKAGVATALLSYHFKNREGLLMAVFEYLLEYGNDTPVQNYLDQNPIPDSKEGQSLFITNLFGYFKSYFLKMSPQQMERCNAYRILAKSHEIAGLYEKGAIFFHREALAFYRIHKTITGIDDWELAYFWFVTIFEPLAEQLEKHRCPEKLDEDHVFSPELDNRFLYFCNKRLLIGLGLWEMKDVRLGSPAGGWK